MPSSKISYLDPLVLARIGNLQIRAKTVVEGFIAGLHQSPYRGHSLEFAQHREYAYGDELKYIDWKVYGRSDRFFVKQFEEETNLRLYIFLDTSGSMGFKGQGSAFSKYDYAATVASSLAYLALKQGDSVGLGYSNDKGLNVIPPRNSFSHLNILLEELERVKPKGEINLAESLNAFSHSCKKRSLIVLISDLLDDQDAVLASLKFLGFKKHEVIVVHLLDKDEEDFPYSGPIRFDSMENSDNVVVDSQALRKSYRAAIAGLVENYRVALRKSKIRYYCNTTDEPLDKLLQFILMRSR